MKVVITDVNQGYSFETQTFDNSIIFQLPSGRLVRAKVEEQDVAAIILESQGVAAPPPRREIPSPPPRRPIETYEKAFQPFVKKDEAEQREFEDPDPFTDGEWSGEQLAAPPPAAPVTLLEQDQSQPQPTPVGDWPERELPHHVDSGMVEWETLPDTQLPPSIKKVMRDSQLNPILSIETINQLKLEISSHMANRPKAGKVSWDTGPRRQSTRALRRSVPMDEAGNPLPPGGIIEMQTESERTPSEEDDGVPQA